MESKKVEFFNKLSFVSLLFTLFVCLFFFIPYTPVTLEASKGFLLSLGSTLALFFWLISRLGDGKFLIPRDKLILLAGIIPLVFLVSSFFSRSLYVSLFGSGFEIGTFGSMLILFIVFFLSSIHFQSEKRIWYFIGSIFIGGLILILFESLSIFIDFNNLLPGFFKSLSSGNLVGSWNNFALLFGVIILLSVLTIELLKTKKLFTVLQYLLLSLGVLFLIIINIKLVWILVGSFSLITFVYILYIQRSGHKIIHEEGNRKKFPFLSLLIVFISFFCLIGSNWINNFIPNYININNTDIRPSIVTTSKVAWSVMKTNPLFGTGPNTFALDWALWQPHDIIQTVFWNTEFAGGFSLLSTFLITTGIIGFIAVLLFLIIYIVRSAQSVRVVLHDIRSSYFILTILIISIYSWITIIVYNPNIIMLMLAFASSGILIGMLVYKKAIPIRTFSFLSDPRHSFFAIFGLVILMVLTIFVTFIYIKKFTSIIYFSKSLNNENTIESLYSSERMLLKAISLDKNDAYYRSLSQTYLSQIEFLISDKTISEDILKSELQKLVNNSEQSAILAIEQNREQYLNYMNLGNVYSSFVPLSVSGSYEVAMQSYDKAFELAPNNPSVLLAKASLEMINKNNDKARDFITQALNVKMNYVDAIFLRVQIEVSEGNLSEAIKQVEYAEKFTPNDPTISFRLGLLKYDNSDYNGAVNAFEKAVILDNNYLDARYFLGQSYDKIGRKDDALIQFNILNKIIPNNQDVKNAIDSINRQISKDNDEVKTSLLKKN